MMIREIQFNFQLSNLSFCQRKMMDPSQQEKACFIVRNQLHLKAAFFVSWRREIEWKDVQCWPNCLENTTRNVDLVKKSRYCNIKSKSSR